MLGRKVHLDEEEIVLAMERRDMRILILPLVMLLWKELSLGNPSPRRPLVWSVNPTFEVEARPKTLGSAKVFSIIQKTWFIHRIFVQQF